MFMNSSSWHCSTIYLSIYLSIYIHLSIYIYIYIYLIYTSTNFNNSNRHQVFMPFLMHAYLSGEHISTSSKVSSSCTVQVHFFILNHGENILKNFIMEFNNFNPNIKFTFKFSEASINFLDLNVSDGKRQTSLFVEPTNRHQYIHCQSSHPKHTKWSLVYSQTLRVSRAYSIILDD